MSERKVLTKYYPPDFDPSSLGRRRQGPKSKGPKVQTVRVAAPFSMRCTSCGEYIYRGRKFNARKETPIGEQYLGIQIYRFYIRCTRCSSEISYKTDPKNNDYAVERGAKRNVEPWRQAELADETDEQRLDRLEREAYEAEELASGSAEHNAMAALEAKTAEAHREMAVADALDEIRARTAKRELAMKDGALDPETLVATAGAEAERRRQELEDEEDAQYARQKLAEAKAREREERERELQEQEEQLKKRASEDWSRLKRKQPTTNLLAPKRLKQQVEAVGGVASQQPAPAPKAPLVDYGSDSSED